jgi:hypothetical protein
VVIARYSFSSRDLLQVPGRLLLVAAPTDRDDAIGIIGVIALSAQGEGRPMIEERLSHRLNGGLRSIVGAFMWPETMEVRWAELALSGSRME